MNQFKKTLTVGFSTFLATSTIATTSYAQLFQAEVQAETLALIEENVGTSQTSIITPYLSQSATKRKNKAFELIQSGIINKGKELLYTLYGTEEAEIIPLGEAFIAGETGDLEKAYNILSTYTFPQQNKEDIQEYLNGIIINLAESALNQNNEQKKSYWLEKVDTNTLNTQQLKRYTRIQNPFNEKDSGYPLKIGVLIPLTGKMQSVGEDILRAMQLSLFHNAPKQILLYPQDTEGTPEGTKRALSRAEKDGVNIVIGPVLSENTQAIKNQLNSLGIPAITFSSDKSVTSYNMSTIGITPEEQAKLMARYAIDNNILKVAIFAPDSTYGNTMLNTFKDEFTYWGGDSSIHNMFTPQNTDYSRPLEKIVKMAEARSILRKELSALEKEYKTLGEAMEDERLEHLKDLRKSSPKPIVDFQALYLPAPAKQMPLIASQLAFYDIDSSQIEILGSSAWNSKEILKNRAEYLNGAKFPTPKTLKTESFDKEFLETYGSKPHVLSTLAYDAIYVITQAYKESPTNLRDIWRTVKRDEGYQGLSGTIKFLENGSNTRLYNVKEVQSQGFKTIQENGDLFPPKQPKIKSSSLPSLNPFSDDFLW